MNEMRLKVKALEKGYSLRRLADNLGMSANSLYRKVGGKADFRVSEVESICTLLEISSPEEVHAIFFE